MLSYQHHYHAGNPADVHKHAALAWMLAYLTRKDKPLTYIETHAGRGLYDLADPAAQRTGEAAQGIGRLESALPADHPYRLRLHETRALHGASAYPGSPLLAALSLRPGDALHLAELHPGEHSRLSAALAPHTARIRREDGFAMAHALCPPTPRRGLLLCDPSYEVKADYDSIPRHFARIARAWNVGILVLWYPILASAAHGPMLTALTAAFPGGLRHEIRFPPVREGHRMTGSGLFVVNPPYGLAEETARLSQLFG
ncbi:23S rRNA (adenine(2030)-N(6))-methyltransferase RlmJ [Roseovarius sp. A46]|uniref:23S rRNA (adenine(2030)-N(6))-methyltransferase RlmJ n=1 Tax=Roseovarius sp. A46 TaxID=2109331 RepID=UPI0010106C56|nr:23S rRNA (adenine(2030)-N(6))-methyltransferase RlmJ [Roseovarius sp. A46]RXV64082.1 23S rRNA (adenine(2030)-N(6))-methyltransferase RlmJ [Roseovarius sp. A46]